MNALQAGSCVRCAQASEIGYDFFKALTKVRSIHGNCKTLLRTHHQRAGLEIMDAMSAHQEAAYERLCRHAHGPPLPVYSMAVLSRLLPFKLRKLGMSSTAHASGTLLYEMIGLTRLQPMSMS